MPVKNYVKVYLTPKNIERIKRLADEDGIGMSEWMRYAALYYKSQIEQQKLRDGYESASRF